MNKQKSNRIQTRQQSAGAQVLQHVEHYEGVFPPPSMLADFDRAVPGSAERILRLAEHEAENRMNNERTIVNANVKAQEAHSLLMQQQLKITQISDLTGQFFGLLVCLGCIAAAIYMGLIGQTAVAIALTAIPTAAIIKAFYKKQPDDK